MKGLLEDECIDKLGRLLGCDFKRGSQYCPLDGFAENYCCEIKQRNNKKDTYPTTIVGKNKIDYWKENYPEKSLYLFFRFNDGDFYYNWDDNDDIAVDVGGLISNPRQYYFVPKELLKKL